ncbi:hypothetical protein GA0070558_110120 [Micromonospora haikouensis]|uniref:SH3 domain-containing protein n=1 Tax=Micromonospora haikouensis TaxID=686309 RepID=A0A1C4VQP2_9ACTN|nr:hypothetical protein [Micromonospora haikouensis]SCE86049.1 hypothetical protein GA0070558_110120 [Micromonospora haikouensis]
MKRKFLAVAAAVVLSIGVAATTLAGAPDIAQAHVDRSASASAVTDPDLRPGARLACKSEPWGVYDSGYAYTVPGKTTPIRSGPYSDCPFTALYQNTKFWVDCRDSNDLGNLWFHGWAMKDGTRYSGWVYRDNLGVIQNSNGAWCS